MSQQTLTVGTLAFTNRTGAGVTLVLEPEGDCIEVPAGQTCRIVPAATAAVVIDCEVIAASDHSITVFLAAVKEVYLGSDRIR